MSVDQLTYGEVLGADESLEFDLLGVLVQVDEDLVFVVEPVVDKDRLNVVLLRQEIM